MALNKGLDRDWHGQETCEQSLSSRFLHSRKSLIVLGMDVLLNVVMDISHTCPVLPHSHDSDDPALRAHKGMNE